MNLESGKIEYWTPDGSRSKYPDWTWVAISDNEWIYVREGVCWSHGVTPDGYNIDHTGIWKDY